jgi:hypothetical protein
MVYISTYVNVLDHIFSRLSVPAALKYVNSNRTGYEASNDDLNGDMESMSESTATEFVWKDRETHDNLSALPASGGIQYFQKLKVCEMSV